MKGTSTMDKVLIVEDNPVLLKILQSGLKKYDHQFAITTARDGQEAIEVLKSEDITLLVTDLQMPKIDGLALLAYMNDHHPEIPCVVMSAHGTPQIKEKISRDVLRFIEKPFEIEELVETILPTLAGDEPAGTLNGISISNFLQMIHMEQKTCLLEIETPDSRTGYFYFEEGQLFDAVFEDLNGEEAALAIIPHNRAKIRFKNLAKGAKKVSQRIQKDLKALIIDAMRMKDESDADRPAKSETAVEEDLFTSWETSKRPEAPMGDDLDGQLDLLEFDDDELEEDLLEPTPAVAGKKPLKPEKTVSPTAGAPPKPSGIDAVSSVLTRLRNVTGYRGSAIVDESGEVVLQDAGASGLDLEWCAAMALELIRNAQKTSAETGLGAVNEVIIAAEAGTLLCQSAGAAGDRFHALVVLGPDGNRALAKITLKKMRPSIEAALA
jgi:CheY-like chemotaxis protein/predicted regulator of Ras-like GTPase activity (Roadblock/LC7/MglB family)